jgi:hypothetical protein
MGSSSEFKDRRQGILLDTRRQGSLFEGPRQGSPDRRRPGVNGDLQGVAEGIDLGFDLRFDRRVVDQWRRPWL